MRLETSQQPRDMENILPLINVIFLLLVFFILSGVFVTPELFEVQPPESASEVEVESEPVLVLLNKDGTLAHGEKIITTQEFRQLLTQMKSDDTESHLHESHSHESHLRIKADRKVAMQRVFEVMDIIAEVGHEDFHLLTLQK